MENKQKAIEKAYGEHWEIVKDYVDENGWVHDNKLGNRYKLFYEIFKGEMEVCDGLIRHISLQGIENNNGWIKIESEADLPKENEVYWVKDKFTDGFYKQSFEEQIKKHWLEVFTHYQPIIKPKPPIY